MKEKGIGMKRMIISLTLAITATMGIKAQVPVHDNPVIIYKTNGETIEWTLGGMGITFVKPNSDGKPVWMFDTNDGVAKYEMDDVQEIKLRTEDDYSTMLKKALTDFYQALDGPNWKYNTNWCSDKPLREWGKEQDENHNSLSWSNGLVCDWVSGIQVENVKGSIPDCILNMGPLGSIDIDGNVTGELPEWLGKYPSMQFIKIGDSKGVGGLAGTIPQSLWRMDLRLEHNKFTGPLPADLLVYKMDSSYDGSTFEVKLNNNDYSGKIPDAVLNHSRLSEFWHRFVMQKGRMDLSGLWGKISAPKVTLTDINNQTFNLGDIYSSHKYTLIYLGRYGANYSNQLDRLLIPLYNAYKEQDESNLEVVELNMDSDWALSDDMIADNVQNNNIPWINVRSDVWRDWEVQKDHLMDALLFSTVYNNNNDFYMPNLFLVDQQGKIVWTSMVDNTGKRQHSMAYNANVYSVLEEKLGHVDYNVYTSNDLTKDGEVTTLQMASIGTGFDIVIMGDGFVDRDMDEGGVYETRMREAVEQFFSVEPLKSLRNRFNVYMVKAVSKYEGNFDGDEHAIDGSDDKAFAYVDKVTTLIPDRPKRAIVINKTPANVLAYTSVKFDASWVAYMKDGGLDAAIAHEAGGHGVGRLLDEYVISAYQDATLSDEEKANYDTEWSIVGRGANVDYHADPTEVKWARFINDQHYKAEELGVYEGAWLTGHGVYRPTVNSLMNDYAFKAFNAPSREAIYKFVMQETEGEGWTYDYETFVTFDEAGRAEFVKAKGSLPY